jgi:ornithine cyclodeaminase
MVRDIEEVRYFDIDPKAMDKFERNMSGSPFRLVRSKNVQMAIDGADIITTCTACRGHVNVLETDWVKPGVHINALGGDCPGKTELEPSILPKTRLVTDYFDQAVIDGEIQRFSRTEAEDMLYAELYEIISGKKSGRQKDDEITLFDSVGMALEDQSAMRLTYKLAEEYRIGEDRDLNPAITDPKDLISVLNQS